VQSNDTKQKVEKPSGGLLTRQDLADLFQVCTHTIQNWERQGKLKAIRINARVLRYDLAQVQNLQQEAA
jgi:predicted site-specific integrase-resolvase